jgi:alpha-1,2-mannosyltransferase
LSKDTQSISIQRVPRAAVLLLWLVVAFYAAMAAWDFRQGYLDAADGKLPLYTDYTPTYAASLLVKDLPAEFLFLQRTMKEAGRRAALSIYSDISDKQARAVGWAPWMYPPSFIPLVVPLAYFSYWISYLLWLAVTAVPYLAVMRAILPARLAWPFALAAPPVYFNVLYGQTGFLSAGLICSGLALIRSRPALAGILIGLASVKPHLGILVPLALAAGGYWRVFLSATLTVIGTIIASLFAFGDEPWLAFIGTMQFYLEGFGAGAYSSRAMTTVLSTLRMAGASADAMWAVQYAWSAAMACLVGWVWWRGRARHDTLELQAAVLCLATPLAIPMAYLYDLVIVVPAAAWIWRDMALRGAARWEAPTLFGALAATGLVLHVADLVKIQIGAALLVTLLALALYRYRRALGAVSGARSDKAQHAGQTQQTGAGAVEVVAPAVAQVARDEGRA